MEITNNMKTVLAELHELINDLEDQGLTAEASTLQEVFVRVAEDMSDEMGDEMEEPGDETSFQADFDAMLDKYGASKILEALADAMSEMDSGDEAEGDTSSFAFKPTPEMQDRTNKVNMIYNGIDAGKTNEEIAAEAGVSPDYVQSFRDEMSGEDDPYDMPGDWEFTKTKNFANESEPTEVDPMRRAVVEKYHNLNEMWNNSGGKEGMDHNKATLMARKEFEGNPPIGLDEIINNKPYPMGYKPPKYDPTASMIAEDRPGYRD